MRLRLISLFAVTIGIFLFVARSSAAEVSHSPPKISVLVNGGAMMNGDHFNDAVLPVFREHFAGCRLIALVLTASHPTDRDRQERRLQSAFKDFGDVKAASLHHADDAGARELLIKADGIFVGGGETFVLLHELYRTGQLDLIRARVLAGVPYAGSSAGANVAGIRIGTTNDFPVAEVPSRNALAIFPAVINPHHPTPDQKADYDARAGKIRGYLKFNPDEIVLGLANATTARWRDGRVTIVNGTGWLYRAGGTTELPTGTEVPELAAKP